MSWIRVTLVFLLGLPAPALAQLMVVALLGTGAPQPSVERFGAAVLVEAANRSLLFDAGRGVSQRLHQLGKSYDDIDKVFITHLHYDHVVGLADLLMTGWVYQRQRPLRVWGPQGIAERMRHVRAAYRVDRPSLDS